MARIFSPPKGFEPPEFKHPEDGNYKDAVRRYHECCNKYVEAIKRSMRDSYRDVCPEAGKEIRFQVADGYAVYVVAGLKPVELVHVDVEDAYQFPYVHRLTASDIKKEIKKIEDIKKLFRRKKKAQKKTA